MGGLDGIENGKRNGKLRLMLQRKMRSKRRRIGWEVGEVVE